MGSLRSPDVTAAAAMKQLIWASYTSPVFGLNNGVHLRPYGNNSSATPGSTFPWAMYWPVKGHPQEQMPGRVGDPGQTAIDSSSNDK
jgi:hypothetical protein